MSHLPPRSARQIVVTWRPRVPRRRGSRPTSCRVEAMEPRVLLSVSVFDETFGNGGRSTFDLYGFGETARRVLALPDGKIVVGISATSGLVAGQPFDAIAADGPGALARLNADGTLDESFSGDGFTDAWFDGKPPPGPDSDRPVVSIYQVTALATQPDGKILAAGSGSVDWMTPAGQPSGRVDGGMSHFTVARFLPDGRLDLDFGNNGLAMAAPRGELAAGHQTVAAIALQPDGKVVAVGRAAPAQGSPSETRDISDWAVIRFNADGSTDPSFAPVIEDFPDLDDGRQSFDTPQAVTVAPDGKIVVGGVRSGHPSGSGTRFAVVRYNADGTKDASFGDAGRVSTHFPLVPSPEAPGGQASPASLEQLHLAPDGKIVATGRLGTTHLALARYNPDGTPDTSFGSGGIVASAALGSGAFYDATLRADGGIDVAGVGLSSREVYAATFGPTGSLLGSARATDIASEGTMRVWAVDVQADGKMLGAGVSYPTADAGEGVAHEHTGDALVFRVDPAKLTPDHAGYQFIVAPGPTELPITAPDAVPAPTPVTGPPVVSPGMTFDARFTVDMAGKATVRRGPAYTFRLTYSSAEFVRTMPVAVVGPNGFGAEPQVVRVRELRKARRVTSTAPPKAVATYRLAAPGGWFDSSENGTYLVRVGVAAMTNPEAGRTVGQFTVAAPQRRTAAARPATSSLRRLHAPMRQDVLRTDAGSGARAEELALLAAP